MRAYFYFSLLLLLFECSIACDVCGNFMGITPFDNQSSIAFMHRYRVFNGYRNYQTHSAYFPSGAYKTAHNGHTYDTLFVKNYSSKDYESYKIFELRAKYYIHQRLELNLFAGIVNNKSKEDSIKNSITGINDPSVFIGYHIIQPKMEAKLKQRLVVGAGVKIPSGNYYVRDQMNKRLPFLMQPGTGSTDYFLYTRYIIAYKKIGLSTSINYKINGTNFYKERVGNSVTNYASLFINFKTKNWSFIPSITSYYENTKGVYVFDVLQKGTNMNELMFGPGMDIYYKNYGLSLGFQKTIHQQRESGELNSVGRFYISLSYNFNQRKYLIKNFRKETE